MLISIIIPAYNEERRIGKSLRKVIKFLDSKDYDYEVLVVSDGSRDRTIDIVRSFKHKNLRLINYRKNMGKGFSVRRGFYYAKGNLILFSDADLSTPISELDKLMKHIAQYDVVVASRSLKGSNVKVKQPFHRVLFGRLFNLLVQFIALPGIKDSQCGFKLFTREAGKKIFANQRLNGFAFDVEALLLARKMNFKVKEIPVIWIDSEGSKVNALKDAFKMLFDIFKIRVLHIGKI
ncbi:glycosyltransferase family 2 protein [Candidatus Woesearchaeota archaeon]|nr:glycosyltransferase family 2 protein [Candidatus Woesearchaeota archaeon]